MPRTSTARAAILLAGVILAPEPAAAQYPRVPPDVAKAAAEAQAEADRRSDGAWQRALPMIDAWAKKGKPYLPAAAKPGDLPQAAIPAFPGAEGGGAYSFGGRGGGVFVVTSLDDAGPGTFRQACEAGGPRIVVFNVSGIVRLKSRIRIRAPYITIAGQSAPGDGVCIAGNTVEVETHDVVIRHMRFRRGETHVGDRNDSLGGNAVGNVMIDHVSASWGLDENMSMYRHMYHPPGGPKPLKLPTVNITIQNSIFSECLNTYNHSFGATIGGHNSTFHHNLFACNAGRNPSVGMDGDFAFVNNVLYNWVHRTVDGGDHLSRYNIINNYYKPGPATPAGSPVARRILKPEARRGKDIPPEFGLAHVAGNVVVGDERVTKDNWDGGVQLDDGRDEAAFLSRIRADRPFPMAPLTMTTAEEAYEVVLRSAGATLPRRDAVDERLIHMVRTGQVTHEPGKGIITDVAQVGGYPQYRGEPYADADSDGMPDEWERQRRLDPKDPRDASADADGDGYTSIEDFLNGLEVAPAARRRAAGP